MLRAHLLRLFPEDRALRFLSEISAEYIEHYCTCVDDHYRIVRARYKAGTLRGVGEMVFDSVPTWLGSCDVARSVEHLY